MGKKGQVTIFIIVAIMLIGTIIGFFFIKEPNGSGQTQEIPKNFDSFYNNFLSCLEKTSNEGIYYIAKHGGYYNVPSESSIVYFTENVPYYYLGSINYVPSINIIEKELGKYISSNLEECLFLENFEDQGFDIETGKYSVLTKINDESVNVEILNIITISNKEDSIQLKGTKLNLNYNLKNLHTTSKEIIETYSENPGLICLTCLEEISQKNNVNITASPALDVIISENNIIWFFINNKEDVSENKLTWTFVVEQ